jgi:hypothetical protein
VAGFRETATHRAELPEFPLSRHEGMPETIDLWLHVTPQGGVIDVKTVDSMPIPTEVRNTALPFSSLALGVMVPARPTA